MNPYLALKRANRKPIKPPGAGIKKVNSKRWNALEHDAPEGREINGRDGTAWLLLAGETAFPDAETAPEPEPRTPGWVRRRALKLMRESGKWQDGDPRKESWWQNPEGW